MFFPVASLRFTHQVKFRSIFWKTRSRKSWSATPVRCFSISKTAPAASERTGGFTPPKFHSYEGICPFGCIVHSRSIRRIWSFANCGSTCASVAQWNPRSHDANHGNSHLSGIEMTSRVKTCVQSWFRPSRRSGGGGGSAGSPSSQSFTTKW